MTMHAIQVVASITNEAAGPSYSVRRLAEAMASRGVRSEIMCTSISTRAPRAGVPVRAFRQQCASVPLAAKFYCSREMAIAIDRAAAGGAVIHSHGLWTLPNLYSASAAQRYAAPHFVSPRGMLAPAALQFSRRAKQAVWMLAQCRAVERATCLHATSQQEYEELRALGLTTPLAIVPNGINLPPPAEVIGEKSSCEPRTRTLLNLGRIHPQKGIDRLIEAWSIIEPRQPGWRLRIVGPSEGGYAAQLSARARALGQSRITFEGPLFGTAKDKAYREADLFVLPTLSENFGMVVAEALANGTPVISTKGAPWRGLDEHRCGWWIDHGVGPLVEALDRAMALPRAELRVMGARGRDWMARDFSWERVAADMERLYRWSVGQGERPDDLVCSP